MLHTRGRYALMVDADGATDITCLEKLYTRTQVQVHAYVGVDRLWMYGNVVPRPPSLVVVMQ